MIIQISTIYLLKKVNSQFINIDTESLFLYLITSLELFNLTLNVCIFLFSITSAHPYLFFNPDQNTITFIGFNIDRCSRNLVDQQTRMILERNIMSKQLWGALRENNVPLQENFDDLSRY